MESIGKWYLDLVFKYPNCINSEGLWGWARADFMISPFKLVFLQSLFCTEWMQAMFKYKIQ